MALFQQWLSVAGLMADFYGVILLTREWPFIFGRGFRRFVERVGKRDARIALELQNKYAKIVADQSREKRRWLQWPYNLGKWGLKRRSRSEAHYMNANAAKFDAASFDLLDANGILDPVAVKRYADHLRQFLDELVEHGEARDLSVKGLKWVLFGLGMQIVASVPLPW